LFELIFIIYILLVFICLDEAYGTILCGEAVELGYRTPYLLCL